MRLEIVMMEGLILSQRKMKNGYGKEKRPIQTIFLRFLKTKQETEELVM